MDDTFLARWLAGELSPAEKAAFEKSPEYERYRQIVAGCEGLAFPEFSEEESLAQFWALAQPSGKPAPNIVPMRTSWMRRWAVAAATISIVLLAINYWYNPATEVVAAAGEHPAVWLPDSSCVTLNAGSSLRWYPRRWSSVRQVELTGEGFFEVRKGADFTVSTTKGIVQVLGTSFNVVAWHDFEVACFTGKVRVAPAGITAAFPPLTPGKGLRFSEGKALPFESLGTSKPAWIDGVSRFTNVALTDILQEMERQFGFSIRLDNTASGQKTYALDILHRDFAASRKVVESVAGVVFMQEGKDTWVVK